MATDCVTVVLRSLDPINTVGRTYCLNIEYISCGIPFIVDTRSLAILYSSLYERILGDVWLWYSI